MAKKLKLELDESYGYDYFENLHDELLILILTKVSSSSSSKEKKGLGDVTTLVRCLAVSKRFNALACLVPTLSVQHDKIETLLDRCPKILKKFKHIRSLQVEHFSRTEMQMQNQGEPLPTILWEAAYRPHSYCLVVVSCEKESNYSDNPEEQQSLMLSDDGLDTDFLELSGLHVFDMIRLHHMLVCSIKDHKHLQRVVVTDFKNRGMLTLEEDVLIKLRNRTSTNLEQVQGRCRYGCVTNLDVPDVKTRSGVVMNNICFDIIEWWDKAADDHVDKDEDDDDDEDISSVLPLIHQGSEMLRKVLTSIMKKPELVNDLKVVVEIVLPRLKSEGYLL